MLRLRRYDALTIGKCSPGAPLTDWRLGSIRHGQLAQTADFGKYHFLVNRQLATLLRVATLPLLVPPAVDRSCLRRWSEYPLGSFTIAAALYQSLNPHFRFLFFSSVMCPSILR